MCQVQCWLIKPIKRKSLRSDVEVMNQAAKGGSTGRKISELNGKMEAKIKKNCIHSEADSFLLVLCSCS